MRAEDFLQFQFDFWPTLYGSRENLLTSIFCTVGNGLEWRNGEINYDRNDINNERQNRYVLKYPTIKAEPSEVGKNRLEDTIRMVESWKDNPKRKEAYENFYNKFLGLSKTYSLIYNIPNNVKPDWLALCYEVIELMKKEGIDTSDIKIPNRSNYE